MALIECRKLTRSYKKGEMDITALADLDLDVEEGEFLVKVVVAQVCVRVFVLCFH